MPKQSNLSLVRDAIVSLNARYGVGDVVRVRLFLDGTGTFVQVPFSMRPRPVKRFRVQWVGADAVRVFALRHQTTVRRN